MYLRSTLAVFLATALVLPPPGMGQQESSPVKGASSPGALKIVVLQGEGAVNSIRTKSATAPAVEVRDENDKPVVGSEVVFYLPASGPGGHFHGWMRTQTTKTNPQGQAGTTGFVPNDEPGRFNIKVTAASGDKTGSAVISQTNSRSGGEEIGSRSSLKWKVLGIVAAGAIVGGVVAAKRGNGTTPVVLTPITISPGPVTVAAPR